jgi:hypothetical protein
LSDIEIYKYIFSRIAKNFYLPSFETWKNKEFIHLSNLILEKTKISISADTLKRLSGNRGNYNYKFSAQSETKKALLQISGFDSWEQVQLEISSNFPIDDIPNVRNDKKNQLVLIFTIFFISIFLMFLFWFFPSKKTPVGKLKLSYIKGYAPNTVTLKYSIKNFNILDSIYIDMGYGINQLPTPEQIIPVFKDSGTIAHCYPIPDVYLIRLKTKSGLVLDSQNVILQSKGWEAYFMIKNKFDNKIPVFEKNQSVGINPEAVKEYNIFTNNDAITQIRNFKDYDIDGDNFDLSVQMQVNKGISCFDAMVHIVGENQRIYFSFVNKGCHKWALMRLSDRIFSPISYNFEFLGQDFTIKKKLRMLNDNKNLKLFVNDEQIFDEKYNISLGQIKGIYFGFKGIGTIDSLQIKELKR